MYWVVVHRQVVLLPTAVSCKVFDITSRLSDCSTIFLSQYTIMVSFDPGVSALIAK